MLLLVLVILLLPLPSTKRDPGTDNDGSAADNLPGDFCSLLTEASIFTIFIPFLSDIIRGYGRRFESGGGFRPERDD